MDSMKDSLHIFIDVSDLGTRFCSLFWQLTCYVRLVYLQSAFLRNTLQLGFKTCQRLYVIFEGLVFPLSILSYFGFTGNFLQWRNSNHPSGECLAFASLSFRANTNRYPPLV